MILNTGKSGAYRYYICSRTARQGKTDCRGRRIRMEKLDGLVLDHVSHQLFTPYRLATILGLSGACRGRGRRPAGEAAPDA